MYVCMYVWMNEWMYVCMHVCMYECMHACTHCMTVREWIHPSVRTYVLTLYVKLAYTPHQLISDIQGIGYEALDSCMGGFSFDTGIPHVGEVAGNSWVTTHCSLRSWHILAGIKHNWVMKNSPSPFHCIGWWIGIPSIQSRLAVKPTCHSQPTINQPGFINDLPMFNSQQCHMYNWCSQL